MFHKGTVGSWQEACALLSAILVSLFSPIPYFLSLHLVDFTGCFSSRSVTMERGHCSLGLQASGWDLLTSCPPVLQPTFPTFSSQRDLHIHFRTRLGNGFLFTGEPGITPLTKGHPHTGASRISQQRDPNCTFSSGDESPASHFEFKPGAKVTFPADEQLTGQSQTMQQCLVAGWLY